MKREISVVPVSVEMELNEHLHRNHRQWGKRGGKKLMWEVEQRHSHDDMRQALLIRLASNTQQPSELGSDVISISELGKLKISEVVCFRSHC